MAESTCSSLNSANINTQLKSFKNLGDGLFSDPTNCAFSQMPADATTLNKDVTQQDIENMLKGSPLFRKENNPKGDKTKIISDLHDKIKSESTKNKIDLMRAQLGCKNVEIVYTSDGPAQNIMNYKYSFSSDLSPEELKKYHNIDVSEYTKVKNLYVIKSMDKINQEARNFIEEKNKSDRPVFVCTEPQMMEYESNTPPPQGISFDDSFKTGLPELNNEVEVKDQICNSIKNMKVECIKSVSISTSSDRRSNCDKSKNIINKDGENECPYISGTTIGRNDFAKLSKDRANKLEQLVRSCAGSPLTGKISKDSSGARGDGSSGICPYDVTNKDRYTAKIKSEYLKGGSSVNDLDQNRYARINIESTRVQGCGGYGKTVSNTSAVSVKCVRIQARCVQ